MALPRKPAATNGAANQHAADVKRAVEHLAGLNPTPVNKSILERAHEAVNGERQENYGNQHQNFTNIADIWTVILREKLIAPVTPQDVAMCQIGLKLARLAKNGGKHFDSIVDVAGYAECLDKVNAGS
jgi:hypothetical protein